MTTPVRSSQPAIGTATLCVMGRSRTQLSTDVTRRPPSRTGWRRIAARYLMSTLVVLWMAAESPALGAASIGEEAAPSPPVMTDLAVTNVGESARGAFELLTYTITVANDGASTATGIIVTITLPDSAWLGSARASQGSCTQEPPTVACSLGSLSSSDTATVTILVTPRSPGTVKSTARVVADEPDDDPTN